jgi:hypothetical protein
MKLKSRSRDRENPCIGPGERLESDRNGEPHASFTHPDGVAACTVYYYDLVGLHKPRK